MLRQFLPSVVEHSILPKALGEAVVYVADNGSTDGSLALLAKEFPTVRTIVFEENYGFADGYNRAFEQIDAEYAVLLNSDVMTPENWLTPLIERLESDPTIAVVGPKIMSVAEPSKFEYAGAAGGFIDYLGYPFCRGRILSTTEQDSGQYDDSREVFWVCGAAFCVRSEVYHALGGLCGDFFAHMEEIDLCWRMQLAGYKVMVEPHSVAYHLGGGTMPNESPRKLYLNYRNNLSMLFKCAPTPQRLLVAVARPIADMLSALLYFVRGDKALAKATLEAYRDFMALHGALNKKRRAVRSSRNITEPLFAPS